CWASRRRARVRPPWPRPGPARERVVLGATHRGRCTTRRAGARQPRPPTRGGRQIMIHGRRLAGVVLAALLAATGSAACQVSPGLAAQVGDTVITRQEVDRVVASWQRTQPAPPQRQDVEAARQDLMTMLVVTEAGRRYAAAEGLTVPPGPVAAYAEALDLPTNDPYVVAQAEFRAVMDALRPTAAPVEPSPADQREIYDHLREQGLRVPPFDQVQPFLTGEQVAQ